MMAKKSEIYQEGGTALGSRVPDWIASEFRNQAKSTPGQNVKENLACAVQLWISIPTELQSYLLQNMGTKKLFDVLKKKISSEAAKGFVDLPPEVQEALLVVQEYAKSKK